MSTIRTFIVCLSLLLTAFLIDLGTIPVTRCEETHSSITVGHGNSYQFSSIKNALENARNGSIIRIAPGEYHENLNVDIQVEIIGSGSESTFIIGSHGNHTMNIMADNCTISNLNVNGSYFGILISGRNCSVSNCDIWGNVIGIMCIRKGYASVRDTNCIHNHRGLHSESPYNSFSNVKFKGNGGHGVSFFLGMNNSFKGCSFSRNGGSGLYSYWMSDGCVFFECNFSYNQGDGAYFLDSHSNSIKRCHFDSNGGVGLFIDSNKNRVDRCIIRYNNRTGLRFDHTEGTLIRNSIIGWNSDKGLSSRYSRDSMVENCKIIQNMKQGIYLGVETSGIRILKNTFYANNQKREQVISVKGGNPIIDNENLSEPILSHWSLPDSDGDGICDDFDYHPYDPDSWTETEEIQTDNVNQRENTPFLPISIILTAIVFTIFFRRKRLRC